MKKKLLFLLALAVPALAAVVAACSDYRGPVPLALRAHVPAPVPAPGRPAPNPLRNAYFGETHVHTSYSMDANLFGTTNDPRAAYRFAQGEELVIPETGQHERLVAPLDFVAVTDHSEGMGLYDVCNTPGGPGYWSLDCIGMRYHVLLLFPRLFKSVTQSGRSHAHYVPGCGPGGQLCIRAARDVWQDTVNAANEAYKPGTFTTFAGWEYSPTLVDGGQFHRNVIFRSDHVPDNVFSAADGFAEDLLRWLDRKCTGDCQVLTIPHNPNMSWGLQFGDRNADGTPVTRENLALRARYDKLVEIFQIKGSSECQIGAGSTDEECGFENLYPACTPEQLKIDPVTGQHAPRCTGPQDLVRGALEKGLADTTKWGFNPFKFGFVGSTDNHNGLPGDTTESTFKGHAGSNDDTPQLRLGMKTTAVVRTLGFKVYRINPGGLAGVWAGENTRESIFDAMKRRETWGTSGTRIRVRFFGSFGFAPDADRHGDLVKTGYAQGVPMGSDLAAAPAGRAPSFIVWAMRDVHSAPLQRLQVVKGWVGADGHTAERVYDVACSDGLSPDPATHRCASNHAAVDLHTCQFDKDKGAAELSTTWTDPDFHAGERAFYYVRVLEDPTCRYTQYDANRLGVALPADAPATIQERAWTSPIWYDPAVSAVAAR